jgi:hypothetical protein
LATIFLSSYLSVFDWHLIWFVQYTDVITFGLVAVGLIGGSFMLLNSLTQAWLDMMSLTPASKRRWLIGLTSTAVVLVGLEIWGATRQHEGYFHIVNGVLSIGGSVVLILIILWHIRAGK